MANSNSPTLQKRIQNRFSAKSIVGLLIALLVFGAPFVISQSLFDRDKVLPQFLSTIGAWTGGEVTSSGALELSFFPELKATLRDVQSAQSDAPITLTAKSIDIGISLWPTFVGKVEISSLQLNEADIVLHAQATDFLKPLWASKAIGTSVVAATKQVAADMASPDLSSIANAKLGKASLVKSNVSFETAQGQFERFANVEGTLAWPSLHSSALVTVAADWRYEPLKISAQVAHPLLFLAGGNSDTSLKITSSPMSLEFDGNSNLVANFFAAGKVSWKTPSMRRFLQWVKASSTAGEAIGSIELNADLVTKDGKLLFNDMTMLLSGSAASGALEVDPFVKPIKSSGTLAFKSVDLVSLASSLPIGVDSTIPNELHLLDDLDLDLRLSAEEATLAGYSIANAAGAIRIAKGDASIDLGTGEIAGGTVMGRLELSGAAEAKSGHLVADFSQVHLDQMTDLPVGMPVIAGPISGKFEVAGPYPNLSTLLSRGSGTVNLAFDSGVIRNFNLETLQSTLDKQHVFELPTVYAGMSDVQSLNLVADIHDGVVAIKSASAIIDGRIIALSGAFPLMSQGIALHGLITDAVQTETSKPSSFFLGGTWKRPLVTTQSPQ